MFNLGDCFYDGNGLQKDHSKAVYWYQKAADLGDSSAMKVLGVCYHIGQGIQEDQSKGDFWLEKAYFLGESNARDVIDYFDVQF
ncbi:hypothetical protein GEMRC1_006939 [Eukaryota sp. GEM-RC1]